MALRAPTQWLRTTLQKAKACIVVGPDSDAPEGSYRKIRLVMRQGIAAFQILEEGFDANKQIAASRSYEWPEVEGPFPIPHFELMPNQVLWGIAASTIARAPGTAHCSVIVEFHDGVR